MDENVLDQQVRRFLKKVGITSQREIERAVHAAIEAGTLPAEDPINAQVRLSIPELGVDMVISDRIALN